MDPIEGHFVIGAVVSVVAVNDAVRADDSENGFHFRYAVRFLRYDVGIDTHYIRGSMRAFHDERGTYAPDRLPRVPVLLGAKQTDP